MEATNWLGQAITEGTIVGRGARDGNTSSFKVGRVKSVVPDPLRGDSVSVEWLLEPEYRHRVYSDGVPSWRRIKRKSVGRPDVDTLFVLDESTFGFNIAEGGE